MGNSQQYDGLSAIAVAIFVLVVVFRGNGGELVAALKGETGFLKWIIALLILRWIAQSKILGEMGALLVYGVYILLLMRIVQNATIMKGIRDFWAKL